MPNRTLRESCRTSPTLAQLSDAAERLFWRLITTADDYGRFQAEPEIVAAACFPRLLEQWPVDRCAQMLAELATVNLVTLYAVGDRQYGEFVRSDKYFNRRAKTSKYPACQQMPTDVSRRTQMLASAPEVRGSRNEVTRIEDRGRSVLSALVSNGEQPPTEAEIRAMIRDTTDKLALKHPAAPTEPTPF